MKKILAITLSLLLAFSGVAFAASKWGEYKGSQIIRLTVDGTPVKVTDVPAVNLNQRTMIPVYLLQQAGIKYTWDQVNQTVNIVSQKPVEASKNELAPYLLDMISKSVYKVLGSTSDPTKAKQGSGFVYNGYFITNAHVAGDSEYAQVEIDGKTQRVTQYQFVNNDTDLMGFKVSGGTSLPISTELPKVGDKVYDISYPDGKLKISQGVVKNVRTLGGVVIIDHTAETSGGSSGGVLLSGSGEVIGINKSGIVYNGENNNAAIPAMYLEKEINK